MAQRYAYGAILSKRRKKLVVVSGSPASAKTALAGELARHRERAVIAHDTVRLGLADAAAGADACAVRGAGSVAWPLSVKLEGIPAMSARRSPGLTGT